MKLLIDHDILIYKSLWGTVDLGYFAGIRACDNTLDSIFARFDYPDYQLVLTGKGNFRKKIDPNYKAKRKASSRPPYLYDAKQYYKKYWDAVETSGIEADDYIASSICDPCVIVSEDHDFKQVGVPMFNPRTWEYTEITNPEYWWWLQVLTGCETDNVSGLKNPAKLHHKNPPRFTEATAAPHLENKSKEEMKSTVIELYKQIHHDNWFAEFDKTCRLLFLQRSNAKQYFELY